MIAVAPPVSVDQYLSAAQCIRRYPSLSRTKLYRLAARGELRVLMPPGNPPRYSAADLEQLTRDRGE